MKAFNSCSPNMDLTNRWQSSKSPSTPTTWGQNIARGTTDPEIDSVTWIELGNKIAPLTLVAYWATRWRHLHYLQIWPTDGAIYISCNFGLQMAPLA